MTSISFPFQDSGTLTAVMAVLCEWNGTDPQVGGGRYGRGVPSELSPRRDSIA